jgi:hypothetical protein
MKKQKATITRVIDEKKDASTIRQKIAPSRVSTARTKIMPDTGFKEAK